MRTRGSIDDDGGDIFGGAYTGRDCDLREDGLDLVGNELILDESGDQAGFARRLIAADADADCDAMLDGVRDGYGGRGRGLDSG